MFKRIPICDLSEKTGLSPDHDDLLKQFHHAFMHENALNPMVFPSLRSVINIDGEIIT